MEINQQTKEKIMEKLAAASEDKTVRIFNDIIEILHGGDDGGGGGSSSGGVFVIRLDPDEGRLDKTYSEIVNAIETDHLIPLIYEHYLDGSVGGFTTYSLTNYRKLDGYDAYCVECHSIAGSGIIELYADSESDYPHFLVD